MVRLRRRANPTNLHSSNGKIAMRIRAKGINPVRVRLASGEIKTYFYHRATGTRLAGEPGSPEFIASLAGAENFNQRNRTGNLSGLIRDFESTKQWRRLAESTKVEYRRVLDRKSVV